MPCMGALRGLLGLALLILVAVAFSRHRRGIRVRTILAALGLQVVFAILVLRWPPGERALKWAAERVESLIGFTEEGTAFVSVRCSRWARRTTRSLPCRYFR